MTAVGNTLFFSGYDSTNGDFALAKFDNESNCALVNIGAAQNGVDGACGAWEELYTGTAAAATAGDPVTVAVSSDGSAFAVGYAATSGDNASMIVFYDE